MEIPRYEVLQRCFLHWAPLVLWMRVVDAFAWYNKGVLQNKNRKYYFSSTKAESGGENPRGLHGSWQEENNQRGKDRRGAGGGGG